MKRTAPALTLCAGVLIVGGCELSPSLLDRIDEAGVANSARPGQGIVVFNSTVTAGAAACLVARNGELEGARYSNYHVPLRESRVEFFPGSQPRARTVAKRLGIDRITKPAEAILIKGRLVPDYGGSDVAVVVGRDLEDACFAPGP